MDIESIRNLIEENGVESLLINDLRLTDLPNIGWAGDSSHLKNVAGILGSKDKDKYDYLVVRTQDNVILSKILIEHGNSKTESAIGQFATHPAIQSLGIGTKLMAACEDVIKNMGKHWIVLGVETTNLRALKLYERLGYSYFKTGMDSWQATDKNGLVYLYETEVLYLRKSADIGPR